MEFGFLNLGIHGMSSRMIRRWIFPPHSMQSLQKTRHADETDSPQGDCTEDCRLQKQACYDRAAYPVLLLEIQCVVRDAVVQGSNLLLYLLDGCVRSHLSLQVPQLGSQCLASLVDSVELLPHRLFLILQSACLCLILISASAPEMLTIYSLELPHGQQEHTKHLLEEHNPA